MTWGVGMVQDVAWDDGNAYGLNDVAQRSTVQRRCSERRNLARAVVLRIGPDGVRNHDG